MILTTYDKDLYEKTLKEDAREEGREEGRAEIRAELNEFKLLNKYLLKSQTLQRPRTRYRRHRISKETIKRIWHRIKTK